MNINALKSLLFRFHVKPTRLLGQNFLLSEEVLDKLVAAAELTQDDTVLEIGPGLGFLTKRLARKAGLVIAIEKDRKLYKILRKHLKRYKNVKLIEGDALFLENSRFQIPNSKFKVVANIPYYLTGKVLEKFLSQENKPQLMVLLLQKEVAERITARPGEMSLLSVSVQFYADPEIVAYVGRENFYPEPEVDSAIIKLKLLRKPRLEVDEKRFFQLIKIGFASKRKQLHNNLASALGKKDYKLILQKLELNPLTRAEDLSLEDWARLASFLFKI